MWCSGHEMIIGVIELHELEEVEEFLKARYIILVWRNVIDKGLTSLVTSWRAEPGDKGINETEEGDMIICLRTTLLGDQVDIDRVRDDLVDGRACGDQPEEFLKKIVR